MTKKKAEANDPRATLMLVSLNISRWYPRKMDRSASEQIARAAGAENVSEATQEVGRYHKILLSCDSLKAVQKRCDTLRAEHYKMTQPWDDNNRRALPSTLYFEWVNMVNEHRSGILEAAQTFIDNDYSKAVKDAKSRLGALYNASDYPPVGEIEHRFGVSVHAEMLPDPTDARVWGFDKETTASIREDLESAIADNVRAAQGEIVQRVMDRASEFVEKVGSYHEGKTKRLFESAITNLADSVSLVLRGMNITNDPKLTEMADELEGHIRGLSVEQLRVGEHLREEKLKKVGKTIKKFQGIYGSQS